MQGLKAFPRDERPPAALIFWTFRIMVGLGFLMLGLSAWAAWRRWQGRPDYDRWLLRAALVMGPMGFVALLCGWITTEVGRQPWTVYGLLRTADSVSPVERAAVATSLTAYVVVYFAVFGAGIFYLLRLMRRSPALGLGIDELGLTRTAGITPGPAEGTPGH